MDMNAPITERLNQATLQLDEMSTSEILNQMNQEDQKVALVVQKALPQVEVVVDLMVEALQNDRHVFYLGAGTSGRLGVLDAAECPPTFGVSPDFIQAIMAGGETALRHPIEGAEDDGDLGIRNLRQHGVGRGDVLISVSASGNPAYVVEALRHAKEQGITTVILTCNPQAEALDVAEYSIVTEVGAEVLTGSSRLKAGTAQKMVLNMLSTTTMVKLGKTYGNLMVDVKASNAKLKQRAVNLVCEIAKVPPEEAIQALERCQYQVKLAVLLVLGIASTMKDAQHLLEGYHGQLRACLQSHSST
jgi:N-acetylmuramic acid 6-phosphate etherase